MARKTGAKTGFYNDSCGFPQCTISTGSCTIPAAPPLGTNGELRAEQLADERSGGES